jgi:hypothetical protein
LNENEIAELNHGGFLPTITAPLSSKLYHGQFVQCFNEDNDVYMVRFKANAVISLSSVQHSFKMNIQQLESLLHPFPLEVYEFYMLQRSAPVHIKIHHHGEAFALHNGQLLRPGNSRSVYFVEDYYLHKGGYRRKYIFVLLP